MPLTKCAVTNANVLLGDGVGTTGAPGSYFGFGQAGASPASTGPRIQAGSGNPNGVVTSPIGSIWIDSLSGAQYRNTDGAMAWTALGGGATGGAMVLLYDSGELAAPANIDTGVLGTGYRAHWLVGMLRSAQVADATPLLLYVNNDLVIANYFQVGYVQGTAAMVSLAADPTIGGIPAANSSAGRATGLSALIPFPESTALQKWVCNSVGGDHRDAGPGPLVNMFNWRHNSTAAIASYQIDLTAVATTLAIGSRLCVYGIV